MLQKMTLLGIFLGGMVSAFGQAGGVRMELRKAVVRDGLVWLSFRASNRSAIDFRADPVRFAIRSRRAFKRRALQEIRLVPVVRQEPRILRSDSTICFADALAPRVPGKGQELVVEWVERNGDRRVRVRVGVKTLLKAKKSM
jgi:hypothetical protein